MLNFKTLLATLLVTTSVQAVPLSFSTTHLPITLDALLEHEHVNEVIECPQNLKEALCLHSLQYYSIRSDAMLELNEEGDVAKIILEVPNSAFAFNQLHLNMRRDRWSVVRVNAEADVYDVEQELGSKSVVQVDKELVAFINKTSSIFERRFDFKLSGTHETYTASLVTTRESLVLSINNQPID
ncbi:hypothetical protein [Vibrio maerlii]|uniref:hypothetical protein n=1 Tax=Vibrio maerlii TaxID=2231648 RepID=UPI000E3DCB89|nr:hypothetical protein [Vibrio maerlii]